MFSEQASSIAGACRILDITPHSVYNQCARDPKFADKLEIIKDRIRRPFAEDMLHSLIGEKDFNAIKFYLTHHGGRRWNDPRILPILIREEAERSSMKQVEEQRLPTFEDKVCSAAYIEAHNMEGDIPDTLILDLRELRDQVKGGRISCASEAEED